eukprot:39364-Eustigmatos_ZCMA.PRE.1
MRVGWASCLINQHSGWLFEYVSGTCLPRTTPCCTFQLHEPLYIMGPSHSVAIASWNFAPASYVHLR